MRFVSICMYVCMYVCIDLYVCMHACMHVCMYVYVYVYVRVYVYIYIYTYIVNGREPVSKEDSTAISNAMARCPKSLSETRTSPNSASFSFLALLQLQSQSASSEQGHPVPIQKAAPNGSGRMNPLPPSPGCQARNDYGIDIWSMVDLYWACHWVHMSPHECKSHSSFFYICFLCFVLSVQN